MGTATVAILRLPLSAVVLAALLTSKAGVGAEPLTIVGVVVTYLVTLGLSALQKGRSAGAPTTAPDRSNQPVPAVAK